MTGPDELAFPNPGVVTASGIHKGARDGLTKRELFAAMAIMGVAGNISVADRHKVASAAREFADALIAELAK